MPRRNLIDLVPKPATGNLIHRRRATTAREFLFTLLLEPPRVNEAAVTRSNSSSTVVWDHPKPLPSRCQPGRS
ncbi:MAG: hypothetical protein U0792_18585 [Gemmataceae bacterium]